MVRFETSCPTLVILLLARLRYLRWTSDCSIEILDRLLFCKNNLVVEGIRLITAAGISLSCSPSRSIWFIFCKSWGLRAGLLPPDTLANNFSAVSSFCIRKLPLFISSSTIPEPLCHVSAIWEYEGPLELSSNLIWHNKKNKVKLHFRGTFNYFKLIISIIILPVQKEILHSGTLTQYNDFSVLRQTDSD